MARGASLAARAERWRASGLFDVEFYSALRGRTFASETESAEDFVEHGMGQRLSSHPLLDVLSLPAEVRRAYRLGKVNPVLQHLTDDSGQVHPAGPLADHRDLPAVTAHLTAVARGIGSPVPGERDGVTEGRVVAGRTSVVVLSDDSRSTVRSVASVLRHAGELDVEAVVVDRGLPPHVLLGLHAWACRRFDGVPMSDGDGWLWAADSLRLLVADRAGHVVPPSTGDVVVRLDASCEVRRGWLPPLRDLLHDPEVTGVQPLLLRSDDLIAAAGLADDGSPLLEGHPPEDALRIDGVPVSAISDLAVARRVGDAGSPLGSRNGLRVAPTSWVSTGSTAVGSGLSTNSTDVGSSSPGQLRWSIKLPSPPGGFGDAWGDTHYAGAVAAALRRLGQDVVTRRRGAHLAGPIHLDDVSLALRGLHPIPPTPGQRNVLWVISHPDDVDPSEFEGYDLVCAASTVWSAEMSARSGREVLPLLQASEFGRPADSVVAVGEQANVVFVGTNLGTRERPLVWQAVEAQVPLTVYGPGWDDLPAGVWQGEYVANDALPDLYRRHGIVLADHWPDMARGGFIANRVFDAVATGAKVISDDVAGLHEVFDPRDVVVARSADQVRAAVTELRTASLEPATPLASLSFDDRAAVLLDRLSAL